MPGSRATYPNAMRVAEDPDTRDELRIDDLADRLQAAAKIIAAAKRSEDTAQNRMYTALTWLHDYDDLVYSQRRLIAQVPAATSRGWYGWDAETPSTVTATYASPASALDAAKAAGRRMQHARDTGYTALNVARETVADVYALREKEARLPWPERSSEVRELTNVAMARILGVKEPRISQMAREIARMRSGIGPRVGGNKPASRPANRHQIRATA